MRNRHIAILPWLAVAFVVALSLSGCRHNASQGAVHIERFEQVLLNSPSETLADSLASFARRCPTPLLRIFPDDEQYMQLVMGFRSDSVVHMVNDTIVRHLGDLAWLEQSLYEALARAYKLDTAITCSTFVTYISNAGYANRVAADSYSRSMTISIDEYVSPQMQAFGYFGEPLYIVRQCTPEHIAPDCMSELVRQHIAMPEGEMTLLDYIVAEGKVQYFLHKVFPRVADSTLFRYTDSQMQWMEANEANVWGYFVQNKMLYSHDYGRLRNFIDDAPKTNAFHESAPRTVEYIGYRMVSRYMKKSGITFHQLLGETDGHKILYESGYRP